jgi:hypothetical protein
MYRVSFLVQRGSGEKREHDQAVEVELGPPAHRIGLLEIALGLLLVPGVEE